MGRNKFSSRDDLARLTGAQARRSRGWTNGDVAFTDPRIVEAAGVANSLLFEPGFVRIGPEAISNENFTEQMFHLLQKDSVTGDADPACWMFLQGGFMFGMLPPGSIVGQDVDYFPMPTVERGGTAPLIGSVTSMIGVTDRPEVRVFLEYLASPEWGVAWASEQGNGFIALNATFDTAAFDLPDDPSAAARRRLFTDTQNALQSEGFRRDASDQMPQAIGQWFDQPPAQGAFCKGMTDWVDGVRTIDEVAYGARHEHPTHDVVLQPWLRKSAWGGRPGNSPPYSTWTPAVSAVQVAKHSELAV